MQKRIVQTEDPASGKKYFNILCKQKKKKKKTEKKKQKNKKKKGNKKNSKSHFLNENKNDDGFLASLGANRRRSYFHSVFHILILTIVPESKNWPNPNESYHELS